MKIYLFLIFSVFLSTGFAVKSKAKKAKITEPITTQILKKYSESAAIKAQFLKTDFKKTLGIKNTNPGELQYADGKINILITGEKKSEIIYNGNHLWVIEYPDVDFDPKAKRKVTEIHDHKPALAQQIIGLFQAPEVFIKNFKTVSEVVSGKMTTIRFESKDKAIQNFEVEFNTQKLLINSIQFTDDVQTKTHIEFKQTEFLKKADGTIFEYKRKKDDEVM
jgi:outer membrane lipoprotein-sorting protein